ncbi:hypothetical protein CUMW_008830 [Citrus unshiu]|nr:hypothetical protein CUMW_008830 [Citrus unshiu]
MRCRIGNCTCNSRYILKFLDFGGHLSLENVSALALLCDCASNRAFLLDHTQAQARTRTQTETRILLTLSAKP